MTNSVGQLLSWPATVPTDLPGIQNVLQTITRIRLNDQVLWQALTGQTANVQASVPALPSSTTGTGAVVLADGPTTSGLIDSTGITTPSINGGQLAGFRNRIINGDMRIDQRNVGGAQTVTTSGAQYTVDRWFAYTSGASATIQRSSLGANPYVVFTGAASVSTINFAQRIEATNIADLAGSIVTVSATLSNTLLTTVSWVAYYAGSTDNFTSPVSIASGAFTVTPGAIRYSTQIALPANAVNGIEIIFYVGAQTSGNWSIGEVQLEAGSVATPFERIPIGMELALCQRYYLSALGIYVSALQGGSAVTGISYPTTMRSSPTIAGGGVGFTAVGTSTTGCAFYTSTTNTYNLTFSAEL
jgi:hypothetical protein